MIEIKKDVFKKYAKEEVFNKIVDIKTIKELIEHINENYKELAAIQKKDKTVINYNDFVKDIFKVQNFLKEQKVQKEDHIGIYCNNNYDFAIAAIGVMSYGAVAVLIPVQIKNEILTAVSKKYNINALIYENILQENVNVENSYDIDSIYKLESKKVENEILPDNKACIVMTGGTTGKSKGAVLTHQNVMAGVINGCYGINEVFNQKYYSVMPLTHVFGFIRNLLTSLYTGSTIYFNYNKAEMFKDMQMIKPTVVVVVPALAEMFLKLVNQFGINMLGGELKLIIAGGATVPQYLVEEYSKLNITLCPGYGLTELANMVSGNPIPKEKPNSVGLIFPGIQAKIEDNELWLKGTSLMKEYYNEPDENKNSFEDGWFKTGDLAKFDEDKFLYITGRIKDIIVLSNGENISPAEIESSFNSLDFIQDSLVYEKEDKLILEVVIRQKELDKYNPKNKEEFINNKLTEINNKLPSFSRVSKIIIRTEDFERSPSMKIIRPRS